MDRTRTLGCEQGCCGTRLPTREAQVRVLYRLRGAAKHEDRSDSLMQPPFQHKRPSFKEKKAGGGGGTTAEAGGKASVPQELELAVRDEPDCSGSVTVCWVSHLRWAPPHHPPSTASSVSAQSWFFTLDYEEMFGAGGTKKQLRLWLLTTIETMLGRLKQSDVMWRWFTSTDKMLGSIQWPKDALLC